MAKPKPPNPPTPPKPPKPPKPDPEDPQSPKPSPDKAGSWEAKADRILDERATITHIKGESDLTQSDYNFFDVYEISPDRTTGEKYLISGNKESIALQTSLLLAIRQMVGKTGDFDWEEWRQAFEDGFPLFTGKSKRLQANPYWGRDKGDRPKIIQLPTAKQNPEYKLVEFFPNRSNLSESYLFSGTYTEIREKIETAWAIIQNLEGMGLVVGYPVAQYLRQEQKSGIELCIMLASAKQPPFVRTRFGANGFEYTIQPRQVTIPHPRRDKLTFSAIKKACGNASGLEWGNWIARAYVALNPSTTNLKGLSQLVAGGPSEEIAYRNLERFLELSEGHAVGRSCTEVDLDSGSRKNNPRSPYLKRYEVYPAWCHIQNNELLNADDRLHKGRHVLSGKMVKKPGMLYLHPESEPAHWAATMTELLKSPLS